MSEKNITENNSSFIEVTADGRAKSPDLSEFEQFKRDRGWEFQTEETLQEAYNRLVKCQHGLLLN